MSKSVQKQQFLKQVVHESIRIMYYLNYSDSNTSPSTRFCYTIHIMLTKGYKTNPLTDYTFEFALNLLFLSRFRNYEVQTADHNIPEHYLRRIY